MKKLLKLSAVAVSLGMFQAPAMAGQTSGECVTYSVLVCGTWDSLGYSSLKDCRLAEYDRCLAGEPRPDLAAAKVEPTVVAKQTLAA